MAAPAPARENLWLSLLFNVGLPVVILTQGDKRLGLPPLTILLLGLAFPLAYGIWDYVRRRVRNPISIIGTISVLLTGGIGVLKLPTEWVAIKEAAVPLGLAIVILATAQTANPLVRVFLYRPEIFAVDRIDAALAAHGDTTSLDSVLRTATRILAASFLLSAVLNFVLARWIVVSPAGTEAFNQEIGRLTALSYPAIALPSMIVTFFALYRLIHGLKLATGLTMDELLTQGDRKPGQ